MKILFIIDSLTSGGKERRLIELLKGLVDEDHITPELVILSDEIYYEEANNLPIEKHFLTRKWKKDPTIYPQLLRIVRRVKPDIIHSWEGMASIYSMPIARLLGKKFVNGMISDAPRILKRFSRKWVRSKLTFPFSHAVVANSKAGLDSYHAPKHKSYCVHNGFDFKRIGFLENPAEIKAKFGIKGDKIVGMIGAFEQRKDYYTYVKAALSILEGDQDVVFLAIGDGKDLPAVKKLVPSSLSDSIIFTGKQRGIESLINIMSIGVLSTNHLVHGEGISNVIMEYMALQKPVIATIGGGTAEVVEDGRTGYLVPPGSVESLADKIKSLLNEPLEAKNMGMLGYQKLVNEFSLERMTKDYLRLYNKLVN